MSNTVLFLTQLLSIVAYVGSLFYIYQVLVGTKDATIQLLKERIDVLQKDLDKAKELSPDVLLQRLNDRVKVLTDEIERLSKDKVANEELIRQINKERDELQSEIDGAVRRLTRWNEALKKVNEDFSKPLDKVISATKTLNEKPPTL